ncbi:MULTISPECIES: hypothetical protein [unclassified Streptomyces]|uniref:hypothetical protein n=1 Tax=unclassified Streptomyces TaxID=2593676 RepID=UPI00324D0003
MYGRREQGLRLFSARELVVLAVLEVGRPRKVLVCAPGLAHCGLTPTDSDDLLLCVNATSMWPSCTTCRPG